jgi:hypothetical protein
VKGAVLWDFTSCSQEHTASIFRVENMFSKKQATRRELVSCMLLAYHIFYLEDGSSIFFQNPDEILPDYKPLHSRSYHSSNIGSFSNSGAFKLNAPGCQHGQDFLLGSSVDPDPKP